MSKDMSDMMKSLRGMVLFFCVCFVISMGAGCYETAKTGRVVVKSTGGEALVEFEKVKLVWKTDNWVKVKFTDNNETRFDYPDGVAAIVTQPEYEPIFNQLSR